MNLRDMLNQPHRWIPCEVRMSADPVGVPRSGDAIEREIECRALAPVPTYYALKDVIAFWPLVLEQITLITDIPEAARRGLRRKAATVESKDKLSCIPRHDCDQQIRPVNVDETPPPPSDPLFEGSRA